MITTEMVFSLIGGLALFIYGMRLMGEGLRKIAGDQLKAILERLTAHPITGVLTGALVTIALQSSSATSVMVVGFVNAGLMTLPAAIPIIMGANVGTTVTAQMIAFRLDQYSLPAVAVGVALMLFSRKRRHRYLGQAILGFGLLFTGMAMMKDAMAPLREVEAFSAWLLQFQDRTAQGVLAGFALTVVVQSSSAAIGILQALASQDLLPLAAALPMIYGENLGTTTTALLSSLGASVAARRAAVSHFVFNVVGTLLFFAMTPLVLPVIQGLSTDPMRQLANAHTIFNLINVLIQLPFLGLLVLVVRRIVPGDEAEMETGPKYLEKRLLDSPSIAIEQAGRETLRMMDLAHDALRLSLDGFLKNDDNCYENVNKREVIVNRLEREITAYLVDLTKRSLSEVESDRVTLLFDNLNDIERVGDHAENIAELAEMRLEGNLYLSPSALEDLEEMTQLCIEILEDTKAVMQRPSTTLIDRILNMEEKADQLEREFRDRHISRLSAGKCHPASGVVFLDVISNLERVADHGANIARRYRDAERKTVAVHIQENGTDPES